MRIAMLSLHSCPLGKAGEKDTGGMNVYIRELSRELGMRGHYIDIFTNSHPAEHDSIIRLGDNINLVHLKAGAPREMPKIALHSYLEKFAAETNNYAIKHDIKYDLIHSHYWLSGLLGTSLKKIWQVPQISMFHTLGAIKNSIAVGGNDPPLRIEGEKNVVNESDLIIAATLKEKDFLINYYGAQRDQVSTIPCGVNLDLFRCTEKVQAKIQLGVKDNKIILYVGRLEPLKGIENLIESFGLIQTDYNLRLIIVGGDNHRQNEIRQLKQISADLSIENNVSFIGSISQTELPLYYNAADICVIPSYYESFGLVALESLACGTPVITTDVGDMKNIVTSPVIGKIIKSNSPEIISAAIREFLRQDESKQNNRNIRRSVASSYSWGTITDLVLKEYYRIREKTSEKALAI